MSPDGEEYVTRIFSIRGKNPDKPKQVVATRTIRTKKLKPGESPEDPPPTTPDGTPLLENRPPFGGIDSKHMESEYLSHEDHSPS